MRVRSMRLAGIGAALAMMAAGARAEDAREAPLAEREQRAGEPAPALDIAGRLRATASGVSLEIGGAALELSFSREPLQGGEPPGSPDSGVHELRASFSSNDQTTTLVLRITPPRDRDSAEP